MAADDDVPYIYQNMNGGPPIGFYETRRLEAVIGDEVVKLSSCSSSTVTCIKGGGVFIAIPDSSIGYAQDGTKVVRSKEHDFVFFGLHVRSAVIDAKQGAVRFRTWYSDDRGLMAFSITVRGMTATYLLEGAKSGLEMKH
jgi:hypothetical protein